MNRSMKSGPRNFTHLAFTDTVKAVQAAHGSRRAYAGMEASQAGLPLTQRETTFIEARDGFYMASVGSSGWPYVQYRGGPRGFLRIVEDTTLAFADFRGNRQYISTGNVIDTRRVALILLDYPSRSRLKVWAEAQIVRPEDDPQLAERVVLDGYDAVVERIFKLEVAAFDWNCPQHITPRYTVEEIEALLPAAALR